MVDEHSREARVDNLPGHGSYLAIKVRDRKRDYSLYGEGLAEIITTWFFEKLPPPPSRGVIIDGGAYLGETSVWFADVS